MASKVRAKVPGYYGGIYRSKGDVFILSDDKHFSARWMDKVVTERPRPQAPKQEK
jgi:hypothetical protein